MVYFKKHAETIVEFTNKTMEKTRKKSVFLRVCLNILWGWRLKG